MPRTEAEVIISKTYGHPRPYKREGPEDGVSRLWEGSRSDGFQNITFPEPKKRFVNYSSGWNIGSQAGSRMGFWSKYFMMEAGTYFLSTTRRNMYSSNHSSVMMMLPL